MENAKRYFKGPHEPGSHNVEYIEFIGDRATRQIDVVGGEWFCSLDDAVPGFGGSLSDQPLSRLSLPSEWEITGAEFDAAWAEAIRQHAIRRKNR